MTAVEVATTPPRWRRGIRDLIVNPWGRPRFLRLVGIGFIVWTLIPIVLAILFSFNPGRSISAFQRASMPAGVRIRFATDARAIAGTVVADAESSPIDVVCHGHLVASIPVAGTATSPL